MDKPPSVELFLTNTESLSIPAKSYFHLLYRAFHSLISEFKKKLNPPWYQGNSKSQHFEGWYFKLTDDSRKFSYAVIPGIYKDRYHKQSHAFIQFFDGNKNNSYYFRFPIEKFLPQKDSFSLKIENNFFSSNQISLDLKSDELSIAGTLHFSGLTPWPKTLISPGIMGWYTWVPFMECYHGIVSLDHRISGILNVNGKKIDFSGGIGYTEKDWGKSFPEAWIWCQANHFKSQHTSLTASIAIIPWIRRPFPGFIMGLWHDGRLFRFTTYNRSKLVDLKFGDKIVEWIARDKNHTLKVSASMSDGGYLQAPALNGMNHQISESLSSSVEIELLEHGHTRERIILSDTSKVAGFEVAGNLHRLLDMVKK